MKKILTTFIILIITFNSYSMCFDKVENTDSKYEFIDKVLNLLISIQNDEKEMYQNRNKDLTTMLYYHKKIVANNDCSLLIMSHFKESKKIKIKASLPAIEDYLVSKNIWEKEVINALNPSTSPANIEDKFSDLKLQKDEIDEKLLKLTTALVTGTRFEISDKPHANIDNIQNEKIIYWLGVTTDERRKILKKFSENFAQDSSNINILIGGIPLETFLSFKNSEVISLENIK